MLLIAFARWYVFVAWEHAFSVRQLLLFYNVVDELRDTEVTPGGVLILAASICQLLGSNHDDDDDGRKVTNLHIEQ